MQSYRSGHIWIVCKLFIIYIILILGANSAIQARPISDTQLWIPIVITHKLNTKASIQLVSEARFDQDISKNRVIVIYPRLNYKLNKYFTLGLGAGNFFVYNAQQNAKSNIYLQQQLTFSTSLFSPQLIFANRNRIEEIFILRNSEINVLSRFRNRSLLQYTFRQYPSLYAIGTSEFIFNLDENSQNDTSGLHQWRGELGFGYKLNKHTILEILYKPLLITNKLATNQLNHIINIGLKINI